MLKRHGPRSLMIVFSLLSALVLLLAACGAPTTQSTTTTSGSPVKGGTWTDDLYEEPNSLIPNASSETFSVMVDQAIYTPLFYGDSNGNLHPGLATVVPTVANGGISSDLKTWTFHLRPGLKWSDGQPLDARDVDFTWKLWMNPKFTPASTVGINLITSTDISSDNLSITFHLKQGFEPFLSVWADGGGAPVPAHYYSKYSSDPSKILTSSDNLDPSVVSGPFKMSASKPGDHYTVVRNPDYYLASQGYPYLNSVVFRIVPNQDTILKDLQAGTIDSSWFLDVTKTIAYKALSNYKLTSNPKATNFEAIYLDFRNPILGHDAAVRKAMAMAVDHTALIDTARRGYATPLCTDHSAGLVPGYQPNAPCPQFNPTAAKQLLISDGWTLGSDGYMHKGSEMLSFQYSTTANNLWRADDELILQQDFQNIGIKLNIQNYPASTFFGPFLTSNTPSPATGAQSGKYDLAEFEDSFTYDADDSALFACNQFPPAGFNVSYYCNPALDKLFTQEQETANPSARQQIFDQEHQIYLTDFPFITLYSPVDLAMHKVTTNNYDPAPEGASETINIWQWWCNGGQC
jgi:peptide/nickel transport system substrate-binding protein